jgi:hypothetical protein
MDEVDPKAISDIRDHVATLAERDYPKVWVGKVGLTADELLALQEANDPNPDWLRVEPEELGGASFD